MNETDIYFDHLSNHATVQNDGFDANMQWYGIGLCWEHAENERTTIGCADWDVLTWQCSEPNWDWICDFVQKPIN